jgi:hypothetical protein
MSGTGNGQENQGFVAADVRGETDDLRRILALPTGERERALAERIRVRRERAAAYAAREIDTLLEE